MSHWLDKTFFKLDYNIAKFFHYLELKGGNFSTHLMKFISFLGEAGIIMIIISLILCLFARTRKIGATALVSLAISFIITSLILKPLIERARPFDSGNLDFYNWWINAGKTMEDGYSFPSGHTTASMAFALSIFITSRHKKFTWPVLIFPILMMSSRIYLMVHYFSDCLFALLVGTISCLIGYLLCYLLFNKTKGKFNNFINNYEIKNLFNKNKDKNNNEIEK